MRQTGDLFLVKITFPLFQLFAIEIYFLFQIYYFIVGRVILILFKIEKKKTNVTYFEAFYFFYIKIRWSFEFKYILYLSWVLCVFLKIVFEKKLNEKALLLFSLIYWKLFFLFYFKHFLLLRLFFFCFITNVLLVEISFKHFSKYLIIIF